MAFEQFFVLCTILICINNGLAVTKPPTAALSEIGSKDVNKPNDDIAKHLQQEHPQNIKVEETPLNNVDINKIGVTQTEKVITVSEKTLNELSAEKEYIKTGETVKKELKDQPIKEVQYKIPSEDISDSIPAGFYMFFGISVCAVFIIVFRLYNLRISRAERRYGVQGDRSNQELTPLPTAIEDGNSDEDDHTLFDINRQQIRIL